MDNIILAFNLSNLISMTSTKGAIYFSEIKGEKSENQAKRIYQILPIETPSLFSEGIEYKQICKMLNMDKNVVSRAMNELSTGKYPDMKVLYSVRKDSSNRLVKHYFRIAP